MESLDRLIGRIMVTGLVVFIAAAGLFGPEAQALAVRILNEAGEILEQPSPDQLQAPAADRQETLAA